MSLFDRNFVKCSASSVPKAAFIDLDMQSACSDVNVKLCLFFVFLLMNLRYSKHMGPDWSKIRLHLRTKQRRKEISYDHGCIGGRISSGEKLVMF